MSLEMRLWKVSNADLRPIEAAVLGQERRLEDWIAGNVEVVGMDLLLIGRQVQTEFGGRVDLLALDSEANSVILELKRDRTPREIVAQVLDYGAWIRHLGYDDLDHVAQAYLQKSLSTAFQERFGVAIPETVNKSHSLVVVASHLDDSSERIINYLADVHEVSINAVFFTFFGGGQDEFLGRAWLKDPVETAERAESKKQAPWSGYWFVNVGDGPHRTWEDNVRYGFIGAGQGEKYSGPLKRLKVGDRIFAYMKGEGYVGFGEVTSPAVPVPEFEVNGKALLDLPLRAPRASENSESPSSSEWAVGVKWLKTFPRDEAKTFQGVFANQNIVCKLRHPETLEFLERTFGSRARDNGRP